MNKPTLLHPGSNRILPPKPLYQWNSYGGYWRRILMMENGYYLRFQITPMNPTVEGEWEKIREERITWVGSSVWSGNSDRFTHTLPSEVVEHMRYHLGSPLTDRLLTGDIWSEIAPLWPENYKAPYDVTNWLNRCGNNGGIALAQIQKNPPSWEEIYAAADKKRTEERQARIDAAMSGHAPLTEAEEALGKELEWHDWSYNYSDDGNVARKGHEHREKLEQALKEIPVKRRKTIWAAFVAPYNEQYWRCPE